MECFDVPCLTKYSALVIAELKREINLWSVINMIGQILIIAFGIVAALVIALNDNNRRWLKGVGIAATILVTAINTLLDTLHVRENIDKLIDIVHQVATLSNKLETESDGKPDNEKKVLMKAFLDEFNTLRIEQMKIWGSAGKLDKPLKAPDRK